MRISTRVLLFVILASVLTAEIAAGDIKHREHTQHANILLRLDINGAIGPASSDYITRNLDKAAAEAVHCVLIRIDTPGGLDTSMRSIIKKIIASPVPVVSYVAPGGARAASAGTYILYASHIAAMAPGTNLGAATPVQIGAASPFADEQAQKPSEPAKSHPPASQDAMTHKVLNDAVAYIRSLAKLRGRNEQWAVKAVREAASLPAQEALQQKVIDIIATDQADLVQQLNGRKINVLGRTITLKTKDAVIISIEPDWRSELLAVITNPNIAYILMLIGIYGLIFEFANPGAIVPGTVGGICLLLAMFAFQVLPINYAGIALIILGVALMLAEAFMPSFGMLGIGGIVAFVMGSVILMDTDAPGFGINPGIISAFALSSVLFFVIALGLLIKSHSSPVVSGKEQLMGSTGIVLADFSGTGMIRIHSENWRASTDQVLHKNDKVTVTGIDGLTLIVVPKTKEYE